MSKGSDEKLPWGLKQSAPGSMKTITKDKIEAFEQGIMNYPKKQLSKREIEDLKKKEEEVAAAEVLRDYQASFEDSGKVMKTFIRGAVINPLSKDEKIKGVLYKPSSKIQEKFSKNTPTKDEKKDPEKITLKKNKQEKRKSNLETFKEELKKIQEERESRHKNKQKNDAIDDKSLKKSDQQLPDLKMESDIKLDESLNGKQLTDESTTTNIFLSNLSQYTNEKDLMELFGKYGPLASVKIMWPRSEEEKLRGNNCGFVAFMLRNNAENALKALDGSLIGGLTLRLSWSKSVIIPIQPIYIPPDLLEVTIPPPPSGLPFNAQPQRIHNFSNSDEDSAQRMRFNDELDRKLENAIVKVTIPTERPLLCLIHRMVEFVVREGPEFEAIIMAKELHNPDFRYLYDNQCPAHIYYRWRLFSILQGDSTSNWYTNSFEMFKNGSFWIPPMLNSFTKGESDDSYERARNELELKRGLLTNEKRDKLEDILRGLTTERANIGSAMVFCIDHADCAEEIVDCIIESLSILHTPLNKKIARLFLISDILHNCSVKVANASFYRRGFEKYLPELFKHINSVWTGIDGKMKSEAFKKKILSCIRAWENVTIYSSDYLENLRNLFLGSNKKAPQYTDSNSSNENSEKLINKAQTMKSEPMELVSDDIDGKPLDELKNYYSGEDSNAENLDGKPFNDYDDDIDGKPLSGDEEEKPKAANQEAAKFVASKWETVDPEQLEKQAVTTSKWDFFDEYQSDKNSDENSSDNMNVDNQKSNEKSDLNQQQEQQQSYNESVTLYQQYKQQKEQLSEEKRQMLREIEIKAVKYMDDLETGKSERNKSISIEEQVENYRHHLFRKSVDKSQTAPSSNNNNNNNGTSNNNNNNNKLITSSTHESNSAHHRRSRSRSRSPSNRHRSSSFSNKKKIKSRSRSRSNSPSRRYKKKLRY